MFTDRELNKNDRGREKKSSSSSSFDQFNERIGVSSPLVLLRSIVEQLTNIDVPQAIVLVLKRFRMFDHHVPQLIEEFFPDQCTPSKPMDNIVDFYPRFREEASQQRIVSDDNQLMDSVSMPRHLSSTSVDMSHHSGV